MLEIVLAAMIAVAPPPAPESEWSATATPTGIRVKGKFYANAMCRPTLFVTKPQGFNPKILKLELRVLPPVKPIVIQVMRDIDVDFQSKGKYERVEIVLPDKKKISLKVRKE